jgi:hypothetical protein
MVECRECGGRSLKRLTPARVAATSCLTSLYSNRYLTKYTPPAQAETRPLRGHVGHQAKVGLKHVEEFSVATSCA